MPYRERPRRAVLQELRIEARGRIMNRCAVSLVIWALCLGVADAQIAMPDPALIHGRAIPAAELPQGTVTVRVVREAIGNNVASQAVRLTVNGSPRNAVTDDQGRA